jgi:poly(3-hydroxybutyrate) depolymerase
VDGTPREFIVYVPGGYDANRPSPVVFMIHGSNQSGKIMYESTDWAQEAEQENFIVVYPTSWKYKLTTSDRVEDKWNVHNLQTIVEPGIELKDDVKFIRMIVGMLQITFNVDSNRIYASGFSNGGAFVISRLIPEMNDVFAAYSTAGAAIFGPAAPVNREGDLSQLSLASSPASLYIILGSEDEKIAEITGATLPFPVVAEEMLQHPNLADIFTRTPQFLSLSPTYEVEYEKPAYATMTFSSSPTNAGNQFIFRMVKNMGHVYPSHDNNRYALNAADLFWEFFLQHHK